MQWHETDEIVKALEEEYEETEIEELSIADLKDLIIDLQEFSDDPDGITESELKNIKQTWIELRSEGL
ncbi:MAG: Fe-S cluster assembly protein IscX [Rickettsiaceae bacterium]|nr:Fe-S cluster assembly protein IscX [Rickettsiaceae bacterium]